MNVIVSSARLRAHRPWQRLSVPGAYIRQFTPNWFTVTMGTGVVFLVLAALPWHLPGQQLCAATLWLLDSLLFAAFATLFGLRLAKHRDTWMPLLRHPVQSMFLGAIPMGLVPIINGCVLFGAAWLGSWMVPLAEMLWWLDAALAVMVAVLVPYMMFTRQNHALENLTPLWLLPIVGPEVVASSAAVLAPHVVPVHAQAILLCGYALWAISVPLAFSLATLIFFRLALHKLPALDFAASICLPLGPIGTGSLGLLALGQAMPAAFAGTSLAATALLAKNLGLVGGLLLWASGLWWLLLAVACCGRYIRQGIRFNLGWWGFTFPLGVYTAATLALGRLTGLAFFSVMGSMLAILLFVAWAVVARHTVHGLWHGHLFRAPCLDDR